MSLAARQDAEVEGGITRLIDFYSIADTKRSSTMYRTFLSFKYAPSPPFLAMA